MGYLIGFGFFLLAANAAAARFASQRISRAVVWVSIGSPVVFWLALFLVSPSGDLEDFISALGFSVALLVPAVVGVGVISLLGQFFGKLAKGGF